MKITKFGILAAGLAAVALLGVSCGDDDDGGEAKAAVAALCDSIVKGQAASITEDSETLNAALETLIASDEGELADAAKVLRATFESGDEAALESPEFEAASGTIDSWAYESCDGDSLAVKAFDYGFEGVPAELKAGRYKIKFENTSEKEFHEVAVIRLNEGTTETLEELFELPDEEVFTKITIAGVTFADPAEEATAVMDLEPGKYIIACFIAVNSLADEAEQGPPHFTEGMITEVTVS